MEEFERRKRQGFGHYMTPEELARRAPNKLALVVTHLPGTNLIWGIFSDQISAVDVTPATRRSRRSSRTSTSAARS